MLERLSILLLLAAALTACQTTSGASGGSDESNRVVNAWRICKSDFKGAQAEPVYDACTRVIEEAKGPFWTASGYNNRSLILRYWGRHAEEMDDLNNAIRVYPDHSAAHNNRGQAYATRGEADLAIADFEEALRLNPESALAHNNYAWLLAGKGNYAAASEYSEKAIALAPDHLDAIDTQAHVQMGLGQKASAEETFLKAMKLGGIEMVSQYQEALIAKGYDPGRSDGIPDDATQAALSQCIRDNCRLMLD